MNRSLRSRAASPSVAAIVAGQTGCVSDMSMFAPAGPGAAALSRLGAFVLWTFVVVAVVMLGLILWGALRRRGRLDEHLPHDTGGGHGWILIGGVLVPTVILGVMFVLTLLYMDEFPLHGDSHGAPGINIVGRQWWWEVEYLGPEPGARVTTANEIHIPIGQPVEISLESHDVIHSFWIPRLHGKVDLVPGRINRIRIQADEPGVYVGQCSEYCGAQHAKMRLVLVAESPVEFAAWIRKQAEPASLPTTAQALVGKKLFEQRACGLCHTIRGTDARGSIGPDLTHLMSRRMLGANVLPNKQAWLMAWTTRAQHFKPEARMPNVTDFTGQELNALAQYLLQLH